jgi:LacI family gluconate utilization system Gnt-I transcriptional repressor
MKVAQSRVSMKDVARLSGVSAMTVSRALRDPSSVSQAVLEKIHSVVEKLEYVPNRIAGSLSSKKTTVVALVLPSLRNAMHAETIMGISEVLRREGFQLMISDSSNSPEIEEELIRTFVAQQVCGVILHNTVHSARTVNLLRSAAIPCVETGNLVADPIDMVVSYSNHAAGKAMAEHFIARGYTRAAVISLPIRNRERIKACRTGFVSAMRRAGFALPPAWVVQCDPGLQGAALAVRGLLAEGDRPRALFLIGDVLAPGALFECQRLGVDVPRDIAIAASDNTEWLENTVPSLTTIQYPRYRIGVRAAERILAASRGHDPAPSNSENVGFSITVRQST